jgi:hypothetical protein
MLTKSLFSRQVSQLVQNQSRRNFRAAVILAGNGVYDGTEVTEAASLLIALSK